MGLLWIHVFGLNQRFFLGFSYVCFAVYVYTQTVPNSGDLFGHHIMDGANDGDDAEQWLHELLTYNREAPNCQMKFVDCGDLLCLPAFKKYIYVHINGSPLWSGKDCS